MGVWIPEALRVARLNDRRASLRPQRRNAVALLLSVAASMVPPMSMRRRYHTREVA